LRKLAHRGFSEVDVAKTKTAQVRRHNRLSAAAHLTGRLGKPVSPRTMPRLPVPYIVVLGEALYEEPDLDAYADALLAAAPRRIGRVDRQSINKEIAAAR
jgi:hypothetical protein